MRNNKLIRDQFHDTSLLNTPSRMNPSLLLSQSQNYRNLGSLNINDLMRIHHRRIALSLA